MKIIDPYLDFTQINFPGNQFYQEKTKKKTIVIHHSAGWDNARGMFNGWAKDKKGRVATAYGITDNGTIYRGFNASENWAHAIYLNSPDNQVPERMMKFLSSAQNLLLNKQAIQVEICNWGYLKEKNGKFFSWADAEVSPDKARFYPEGYRGHKWYEEYTQNEIKALERLIIYHAIIDDIPVTYNPDIWEVSERAIRGAEGIWFHSSYRTDKSDAHPQPELISMLMRLEDTLYEVKKTNGLI